jgi:hypothetical protein
MLDLAAGKAIGPLLPFHFLGVIYPERGARHTGDGMGRHISGISTVAGSQSVAVEVSTVGTIRGKQFMSRFLLH